jgi:hypothetical protein
MIVRGPKKYDGNIKNLGKDPLLPSQYHVLELILKYEGSNDTRHWFSFV